jgi:malate permease and related proteins
MATGIIINQLLIFVLLMIVGAIASQRKILNDESKDFLARIIIDITLPFLIFSTFSHLDFDVKLFKNGLFVFILAFINLGILYLTGSLSAFLQKLDKPQAMVHTLHTMFGNIVFLGFPLFDALFPGGIGVFYAAVYQLASNTLTFTYGIYRLSSGTQKSGWRSLLNANTGAIVLGSLILVSKIELPKFVIDAFSGLGKCTSPLSMVYIGALLAGMNIKKAFRIASVFIISFNKLILIPVLLGIAYILLIKGFHLDIAREAFFVLVMQAGMPCQTIIVVMTRRYGGDYHLAASNLFVSTLFSIITLPLLYFILEIIFLWL